MIWHSLWRFAAAGAWLVFWRFIVPVGMGMGIVVFAVMEIAK